MKKSELPSTLKRSSAKAQRTFMKTHDSRRGQAQELARRQHLADRDQHLPVHRRLPAGLLTAPYPPAS